MAAEALVAEDIQAGEELIKALDTLNFKVVAAFWMFAEDSGSWRLWIASPEVGKGLHGAYVKVAKLMKETGGRLAQFELSRIKLVRPKEPMIKALGKIFHVEDMSNVRFSRSSINGVFVEDALIYRMAA